MYQSLTIKGISYIIEPVPDQKEYFDFYLNGKWLGSRRISLEDQKQIRKETEQPTEES